MLEVEWCWSMDTRAERWDMPRRQRGNTCAGPGAHGAWEDVGEQLRQRRTISDFPLVSL